MLKRKTILSKYVLLHVVLVYLEAKQLFVWCVCGEHMKWSEQADKKATTRPFCGHMLISVQIVHNLEHWLNDLSCVSRTAYGFNLIVAGIVCKHM